MDLKFLKIGVILIGGVISTACGETDKQAFEKYICRPNSKQIERSHQKLDGLNREYNFEAFRRVWETKNEEVIELYFKAGIIEYTEDQNTFLHFAAKEGSKDLFEMGLDCGLDIDIQLTPKSFSPLFEALRAENEELVKFMIKRNANLNIKVDGISPLHHAVNEGDIEIVKLMLDKGASVNTTDQNGLKPIDYAHQVDMREFLEEY